ncbi:DUF2147 domain-containing protein [Sedimentimonas flavescens]|uniref:DUF2147 domain-containing protein n=1 Tax=Sedimentimonas flavescens TaxID=2851012 RepID=UPI001C49F8D9|nr:DUF2147 domain-containing protein [Sedimentimonas flavescens]MBW0156533.1 DUF2147 domain-containing protein [Sedimentimonas flavescens]WBL32301.1 DUF2147 domain-containing protein [Sinirhodobacter sp. HNIBRBA609]
MKTTLLAAALALAAGTAFADPIEGLWQTQPDDGAFAHVKIAPCGENYCGTIVRTFKTEGEYASPNLGKAIVIDMTPKGGGAYQGQVWRPSNGKTYLGKIALNGDAMKLAGCVAGGLFCAKQSWTRIK